MAHAHQHDPGEFHRAFFIGVILNAAFIAVEVFFGLSASSLALLADAGHNLSDVLGLLLAWGATALAARPASSRFTYGLRRSTILAALLNALLLLVAVGGIAWEAVRRLQSPAQVSGTTMMIVAGVGVVINTISALLFFAGRKRDLNVRGAFLHMAADAAVSLGVVVAAALLHFTGWIWLDPAMGLIIALVITYATWDLLRDSIRLILDAVPENIDLPGVEDYLRHLPGVEAVHDLHIWGLSTTTTALTAHLVRPGAAIDDDFLRDVCRELHDRFGIEHSTLQLEAGKIRPCSTEASL